MKRANVMLFVALLTALTAQACVVKITNDTDEPVMVYDVNNPQADALLIDAGSEVDFGSKKQKADFVIAQKQSCGKWKKTVRVIQTMCGMTEEEEKEKADKYVTISGILNRKLADEMADFFAIEEFTETENGALPEKKDSSCGCAHKK